MLYETTNYVVVLTGKHVEPSFPGQFFDGYAIKNKNTGIEENTSSLLPEAIRWCKQLQKMLEDEQKEESPLWPSRMN